MWGRFLNWRVNWFWFWSSHSVPAHSSNPKSLPHVPFPLLHCKTTPSPLHHLHSKTTVSPLPLLIFSIAKPPRTQHMCQFHTSICAVAPKCTWITLFAQIMKKHDYIIVALVDETHKINRRKYCDSIIVCHATRARWALRRLIRYASYWTSSQVSQIHLLPVMNISVHR